MGMKYYGSFTESPHDMYCDLAQAFIDEAWDNGAAKTPENGGRILEQMGIGSNDYRCVEAMVKTTVGDVTSGQKDQRDFLKLYFRDIHHDCTRGQYYLFDDCYWIVHDHSKFNGIAQDVGIRRCNNFLRIVDPENGGIFSIPCVVDYDMAAANMQISRYILTPNNHAVVKVQGNNETRRLFKLNTRYILGGRPFKLLGYQNALNESITYGFPTYLELDLFLDELHDADDLERQLADNGTFDYSIKIGSGDISLGRGVSADALPYSVILNGNEVERPVIWESSDNTVMRVSEMGKIDVVGKEGQSAKLLLRLIGNPDVYDSIEVKISSASSVTKTLLVDPDFYVVRQGEKINFTVYLCENGKMTAADADISTSSDTVSVEKQDNGSFVIVGLYPSAEDVVLDIVSGDDLFERKISVKSMFG